MWWFLLLGCYLALISSYSLTELAVGAAAAAACAWLAVRSRRAEGLCYRPRVAWLRWLPSMAGRIPADLWTLARMLVRREVTVAFDRVPSTETHGEERESAWRGLAALALSISPGTYVTEVRTGQPDLLVTHRLGRRPVTLTERR